MYAKVPPWYPQSLPPLYPKDCHLLPGKCCPIEATSKGSHTRKKLVSVLVLSEWPVQIYSTLSYSTIYPTPQTPSCCRPSLADTILPHQGFVLPMPAMIACGNRESFSKNRPLADSFIESRCQFIYISLCPLFM